MKHQYDTGLKPLLRLDNITYAYNEQTVLNIPGLELEAGKIYALAGPNGAGKTTLLLLLAQLIRPATGTICFEGNPLNGGNQGKTTQIITLVLQNPYLFQTTVGKNVLYGLKTGGGRPKERKKLADEVLAQVGLPGFGQRSIRQLSGGEAQLVAIARALIRKPRGLLLDEPFASVDQKNARQLEDLILKINRESGTTIILTSHDLSQAYRLAQKVLFLFNGRLSPVPLHNLFSGNYLKTDQGYVFQTDKLQIAVNSPPDPAEKNHPQYLVIDPEDIILSPAPLNSSALNCIEGGVSRIYEQAGSIMLEVEALEVFKVKITALSLNKLGIHIGSKVYLSFKASSVHTIPHTIYTNSLSNIKE